MNYWYAARAHEIFLDLDSRKALRRAVTVLLVGIKKGMLPVKQVFVYRTKQSGHYHMVIVCGLNISYLSWNTKHAWSLWMGNDRLRMSYVLMRRDDARIPHRDGGDLLVSKKQYHRKADATCQCKRKHKEDDVTAKCPAMRFLLGEARSADYFARTGERRVRPLKVRVTEGELSMSDLKKWVRR